MRNFSLETINMDEVNKLPLYERPGYRLQDEPGNGCFLDPPGYPSYFTQSVYTSRGDSPQKGPQMVIFGHVIEDQADWEGCADWEEYRGKIEARLRAIYKPLPLEHPRVKAWIQELYGYFKNSYADPANGDKKRHVDKSVVWPVPSYKLRIFRDDPRFSEEWRIKEKAAIEQANNELITEAAKIAIPENHLAVLAIKEHYPDYKPDLTLINKPPRHPGDWWQRYDAQFTPNTCPGLYGHKHPANGKWCQMCGWYETI